MVKEQQGVMGEGVRRILQLEEYMHGLIEKFKNGFIGIPEIRLG